MSYYKTDVLVLKVASQYVTAKRNRLKSKDKTKLNKKKKKDPKKRIKSWKQGVKIFKEYFKKTKEEGKKPRFNNDDKGILAYLNMQGYWGFKSPSEGGLKGRFQKAISSLKIKAKGLGEALENSSKNAKAFIVDSEFRNKTLKAAGEYIDKNAPKIAKDLVTNYIGEMKGYKDFAITAAKLMTPGSGVSLRMDDPDNPGEKIWNRDAVATLYGVGAYVAAGVSVALTGGLSAVATTVTGVAFAKSKAMHSILRTVPATAYDFMARKALSDAKIKVETSEEGTEARAKAEEDYKKLADKEEEAVKIDRILEVKEALKKGKKGSSEDFEELKEEYGSDPKYGQYLEDEDSLKNLPYNREVKMSSDKADLKKRGMRELLDRAFLGWEWAEVFSTVAASSSLANKKEGEGGLLFNEDFVAKYTGGTDWLGRAAGGIASAIKETAKGVAKVVTSSEITPLDSEDYRMKMAAAGFEGPAKKNLEDFTESIVRSMADLYKKGFSDLDMKEILEFDVEGFSDGSMVSKEKQKQWKVSPPKEDKKASFIAGSDYYSSFGW